MPLVRTTAYLAMYYETPHGLGLQNPLGSLGAYTGTPSLVVGGSSTVSQYGERIYISPIPLHDLPTCRAAIQFAKASGFNPIIATASTKHTEHLQVYPWTPSAILSSPAQSLTYIVNAISGKDTQHLALSFLEPGGLRSLSESLYSKTASMGRAYRGLWR
jgi:hypothetical protein